MTHLILFFAAVLVAFFFSGIEVGLTSVNRQRLRRRVREGSAEAQRLELLLLHPGRLLATVVIVTTLARILALAFFYAWWEGLWGGLAAALIVILCLPVLALLLEFLPKILFRQFPYRKLLLFASLLQGVAALLAPLTWLVARFAAPRFGEHSYRPIAGLAELRQATNEAVAAGWLTPLQKHYLHSLLNARSSTLAALQHPPEKWPCVTPEEKITTLLEQARQQGVSRFLVRSSAPGCTTEILGVVRVFDLLLDGIASGTAQSYMRRLDLLSPDSTPLEALLHLRSQRADMGLVGKEPGSVTGLVTTADLVHRLLHGAHSQGRAPVRHRGPAA